MTTFLFVSLGVFLAVLGLGATIAAVVRAYGQRLGWVLSMAVILFCALATVAQVTRYFGGPRIDLPASEVMRESIPPVLGVVAGIALSVIAWRVSLFARRSPKTLPLALAVAAVSVWGALLVSVSARPDVQLTEFGDVRGASLPPGFTTEEIVPPRTFLNPSALAVGGHGEVFVATLEGIEVIESPLDDARTRDFADIEKALGLVWRNGDLYAASAGSLFRVRDTDSDGESDETEEVISGLPSFVYDAHSNNGLAFGPDGRLYMTLGGTSDQGPETRRLAGSILTAEPDGSNLEVHARGLRNPYDLAFCEDGRLFAGDNGPTVLKDTLVIPPEEVNLIEEGEDYGYPDFFGFPPPWSDTRAPISVLPRASVPTGISCYAVGGGSAFPADYDGDLFLTLFGSSRFEEGGRKLVRIQLREVGGHTVGAVSDFMTGLARPIDVVEYTDGSLLVAEYETGRVFRIAYAGS